MKSWIDLKRIAYATLEYGELSPDDREIAITIIEAARYRNRNRVDDEPSPPFKSILEDAEKPPENTVIQGGVGINDVHPSNRQPFLNGAGANAVQARCGHVVRSGWRCKVTECAKREEIPPSFL